MAQKINVHSLKGIDAPYLLFIILIAVIVFLTILVIVQPKTNIILAIAQQVALILGGH